MDKLHLFRLTDIERDAGLLDRNLFQIRKKRIKEGHAIGQIIDRAVYVTKEEADYLLSRVGKRGRGNWLAGEKAGTVG